MNFQAMGQILCVKKVMNFQKMGQILCVKKVSFLQIWSLMCYHCFSMS